MGAERRWKLLPFRSLSFPRLPSPASSKPKLKLKPPDIPVPPSPARKGNAEEAGEVPPELLCPILRTPMADPVILPSGRTYERACVRACAELGLSLARDDGVVVVGEATGGSGSASTVVGVAIPNDALRAAVRTWCARSGRAPPVAPSAEKAGEAVLRAAAPAAARAPGRSGSSLSCSSEGAPAPASSASSLSCSSEGPPGPVRSASNLSCSSEGASTSSSSRGSSTEMAAVEVEVVRVKEDSKEKAAEPPAPVADEAPEAEAVAKAVQAGDEREVEAAMAALRRATREEGAARRRALCGPRLLAALRRVLLSPRHTAAARADAAAALSNLALEPGNRVPIVRAGAVPALVDAVASPAAPPEAREHAAGALFGLALHEGSRAAIGVLGAVPPLLALLAGRDHAPRARRDAGMALYHLSLAAVNQSKLARAAGAARALLAVASDDAEPPDIRRLALMVACNVAACAEGRAALMDAGAVATASAILSDDDARVPELQQWCVAALYGMSRGSPRFRGLARAAGADRPLMLAAEQAIPGVHKEMAQTALRTMLGLADDDSVSDGRNSEGNCGRSRLPQRRRVASWSAPPSSNQWRSVCID